MQRHFQNEAPSSLPRRSSVFSPVPEGFTSSYLCLGHLCDLISPTSSHLPQTDPVASVTSLSHLCEGLYIIYALCLDSNPSSIYLAGSQILSGDRLGTMSIKQNRLPTHLRFLMPFFFLQSAPVLSICLHCV